MWKKTEQSTSENLTKVKPTYEEALAAYKTLRDLCEGDKGPLVRQTTDNMYCPYYYSDILEHYFPDAFRKLELIENIKRDAEELEELEHA